MILVLERHRSSKTIGEFSNTNIPHPQALIGAKYCQIIDDILAFPRAGWLLRNIPQNIAETVSAHCSKVAIAASLYVDGHGSMEMKGNKVQIVLTGGLHDLAEWKAPDYTPHDIASGRVTPEQKRTAEFETLRPIPKRSLGVAHEEGIPNTGLLLSILFVLVLSMKYRTSSRSIENTKLSLMAIR